MASLAQRVIRGERVYDGMNLNVPGYERVTLRDGNQLYGSAWVLATTANMHQYNF
jgi:simple sugar transport system substrate-binding protein